MNNPSAPTVVSQVVSADSFPRATRPLPAVRPGSTSPAFAQISRRVSQLRSVWANDGARGIVDRLRRAAAERLAPTSPMAPVRSSDLLAVDLANPFAPPVRRISPHEPITINWVITPPSPGSGGHTTIFRLLHYLATHGYSNRVYFYDAYGGDHAYYASIVRSYYKFEGPIGRVEQGMEDAHVVMATAWPTAYAVHTSRCAGKRFYFIQDFEPLFYPAGSFSSLAECTYRMGYHGLSIGRCFADRISAEFGMTVDTFPYGCDLSQYRSENQTERSGIVFYARRDSARRGTELGLMALEAFARRRPEIEIHTYGDKLGKLPFRSIDHGRISPEEINKIYNRCRAGLSLSFTNVSLVALEMLAAGCIPVLNDTVQVRTDLASPFARYAAPTPQALAAQLEAVVSTHDFASLSASAAASVRSTTWNEAGSAVDTILRRVLQESAAN